MKKGGKIIILDIMKGFCEKLMRGFGFYHSEKRFITFNIKMEDGEMYYLAYDLETKKSALQKLPKRNQKLSDIPEEEIEEKIERNDT